MCILFLIAHFNIAVYYLYLLALVIEDSIRGPHLNALGVL